MKLRYKLSAIIFFLILLVSISNYFFLTQTFRTLQVKRLESAEALLGISLAQKIYRQVIEREQESVVATLFKETILRENKLEYLIVNDENDKLFAHTYLTQIPSGIDDLNNVFESNEKYRIDDLLGSDLEVYNIGVPIREGIIQVGTLHVGISKEFITDAISPLKKASLKTLMFGALVVFFGSALAFALSSAITRSLTKLQEFALNVSQGDYDTQITIKSNDEVGLLAQSFDDMRTKIQEAHNKLEIHNQNLESTVYERTQELAENNEKLETLNKDLDQQRNNLKIVFSAMDYPLYVINTDYTIAMMNDMAKTFIHEDSSYPLTCHGISHKFETPCDTENHPCPMQSILKDKKPVTLEHIHYNNEGEQLLVEVRAYPIFDAKGNVVQIVEASTDITEKKKSETDKIRLERELSRAQKLESIGTLAAGIAHEINTPIQFIGDNTQFAEESFDDILAIVTQYKELLMKVETGEQCNIKETVEKIEEDGDLEFLLEELPKALLQTSEGIDHVANIVKAMKDFSHIGSEQEMQVADINHAIETTLTISKNEWKYVATIEQNLEPNLPMVKCFIGEIKQVLLNLIINAAHAVAEKNKGNQGDAPEQGLITISSTSSDNGVTVSVTDTGTGIDVLHQDKIFDHFYTTKDVGKGTGQGLSVAYQVIVEKHGGKIWFETEKNIGTTFFFTLLNNT